MDQNRTPQQHSADSKRSSMVIWFYVALTAVLVLGIVTDGYIRGRWTWDGTGFGGASLWDWLELLIVPLVLGVGGIWFQRAQRRLELESQEKQRERELQSQEAQRQRELESQETQREREETLADQRTQDAALQSYLDQMSELLTDTEQAKRLRDPKEGHNLRVLARARTLTTLGQLDGTRKRSLLQFLYEAELIRRTCRVVRLNGADLSGANLTGIALTSADLGRTDLSGADLTGAYLIDTDLTGANLAKSLLTGADLRGAYLIGADLSGTTGVSVEALELQAKSLVGTIMPDGSRHE